MEMRSLHAAFSAPTGGGFDHAARIAGLHLVSGGTSLRIAPESAHSQVPKLPAKSRANPGTQDHDREAKAMVGKAATDRCKESERLVPGIDGEQSPSGERCSTRDERALGRPVQSATRANKP